MADNLQVSAKISEEKSVNILTLSVCVVMELLLLSNQTKFQML